MSISLAIELSLKHRMTLKQDFLIYDIYKLNIYEVINIFISNLRQKQKKEKITYSMSLN